MNPELYTGRARLQTERFLKEVVAPVLEENRDLIGIEADIKV